MGNKACAMPWCHGPGDFEVKTSRFGAMFKDDHSGQEEHLQSKRAFQCKTGTQLAPSRES